MTDILRILNEHVFLLNNWVIWAIILTALLCYGLLIELAFLSATDQRWYRRTAYWVPGIRQMLAALPLLGLLGTINGLLTTFVRLSRDKGFDIQSVLTGGIGEAMFTTQLGLFMVIPGLIVLAYLNKRRVTWELVQLHAIDH